MENPNKHFFQLIETPTISPECFEKRCVDLYAMFGVGASCYEALPDSFKEFVTLIGYVRVCSLLVIYDLDKGRSERQLATKYSLTRDQIRSIKENSRKRNRVKWGETNPANTANRAL